MNTTTLIYAFLAAPPEEAEQHARAFLQSFLRGVAAPPFPNLVKRAAEKALQLGGPANKAWHIFPTLAHPLFPLLSPEVRRVWEHLCPVGKTNLVSSLPRGSVVRIPIVGTLAAGRLVSVDGDTITLLVGDKTSQVTIHPYYPVYLLSLPEGRRVPIGGETRRRFVVPKQE